LWCIPTQLHFKAFKTSYLSPSNFALSTYQPINLSTYQNNFVSLKRHFKACGNSFCYGGNGKAHRKNASMKRIENGKARLVCPALGQSLQ
jgi:hypothetical protein